MAILNYTTTVDLEKENVRYDIRRGNKTLRGKSKSGLL